MRRIAILVCALGGLAALVAAGPAAAATARRPLPADEYGARPLCGPPSPGHAACFALELVPQTAAARARATPLGVTLHHSVEPHSAADGTYGLRPQDLHGAYGLPAAAPAPQTIAIVDAYDDPTAEADLATYDAEFGLPACTHANGCFTKVNQHGSESSLPAYNSGWAGEIALDLEAAHAVCQTNCRILLVEAENAFTSNLEAAVETAVTMGATEVSNSYGGPEPATEGVAYDHPGVAIAASTGDDGYLNWSSSLSTYPGHPNYPASSPDVVAVGGTRLTLSGGARSSERVWNDGSTLGLSFGAGGSGCSEHPLAAEWQQTAAALVGCGSHRAAADVAADADPYTGIAVYRDGNWSTVGGTSLSSPIVAATYALAGGTGGLDSPARSLYDHLGSADLFDVTEGSNGECTKAFDEIDGTAGCTTEEEEEDCAKALICRAAAGFDGPTGVGTPEGLAAFAPPQPVVTGISPDEGDLGTEVTISGEYLGNVASVQFGEASASGIVETSPSELTVTAPGHTAGQIDVTVTTGGGASATSSADRFTFIEGTLEQTPVNSSPPTISGTATKGQTLSESHGAWENTPTSYAYQWLRCDSGGASCVAIAGATEIAYKLTAADVGATIRVEETASNGVGQASAESAPTAAVGDKPRQSFTWTGATARSVGESADAWSTAGNWEGGTGPSEAVDVGTLTLPPLEGDPACEGTPTEACYQSRNDVSGLEIEGISVNDRYGYILTGEPFTLGAGGIEATASPRDSVVVPSFRMPLALGADQTWSVDGGSGLGSGGLEFEGSISGESHSLQIDISEGAAIATVGSPDDEVGPVTFAGADSGKSGWEASENGLLGLGLNSSEAPRLNATDGNPVHLDHTALIGMGTVGPLTVSGGLVDVGNPLAGEGTPFGKLSVEGALSLDSETMVAYEVGDGTTPGDDFPQISVSGDVDLGGAGLSLLGGRRPCATVAAGTEQALVSATGALEGTFGGVPEGKRFALCAADETTVVEIAYTAHEAIARSLGEVPYSISAPMVGGYPAVGQTLTAYQGAWWNTPTSYDYQWQRCDSAGSNCSAIPGADEQTYTVGSEDPGHTLKVETTGHNEAGQFSVTSAAGSEVALPAPVSDEAPTISGSAVDGQTLTGADGTWLYAPTSYTYRWLRCDSGGGGCLAVAGATEQTYTLAAADVGHTLKLEVTAHNANGSGSASSAPTGVVTISAPFNTAPPAVSGSAMTGETLSTTNGIWANSPTSYTYQWLRCDSGGGNCAAIPAATAHEYTPTAADVGHSLVAEVTAHNANGSGSATSAPTGAVTTTDPFNTALPAVSGSAIAGETLSTTNGTWENSPTSYTFQWLRCDSGGGNCAAISAATADEYTLTAADVGHSLVAEVTAHNDVGTGSATSAPTTGVLTAKPVNTALPTITGSAAEGEFLTAHTGTWQGATSYHYQWLRCDSGGAACVAISGAVGTVHQLTSEDLGHEIRVEVTGTNGSGSTPATSEPTAAVTPPVPEPLFGQPAVAGSTTEGETVVAVNGGWTHSPTSYTYRWLRCDSGGGSCVAISGGDGQLYLLVAADVGHTLVVEVTAHNGTAAATASSPPSAVVVAAPPSEPEEPEPEEPEPEPSPPSEPAGPSTPPAPSSGSSPTSGSGAGGSAAAPAAHGTAVAGAKAIVSGGKASVELHCTGSGPCSGALVLEPRGGGGRHSKRHSVRRKSSAPIGRASFSIPAGGKATVAVHLDGAGLKLLRKAGRKGVTVSLSGAGVAPRKLLLEGAARAGRRHGKR